MQNLPHDSFSTPLAAIHYPRRYDIDRLLVDVCSELSKAGLRLGGLVQISTGGAGGCATSMHIRDLASGETFNIWDERGPCAKGCRLDERGLAQASLVIDKAIADKVDFIVINRFGRAESLGRGLIDNFARAVDASIPVLSAVRAPYDEAWQVFHGGMGIKLPTDQDAICQWCRQAPFITNQSSASATSLVVDCGNGSGSILPVGPAALHRR